MHELKKLSVLGFDRQLLQLLTISVECRRRPTIFFSPRPWRSGQGYDLQDYPIAILGLLVRRGNIVIDHVLLPVIPGRAQRPKRILPIWDKRRILVMVSCAWSELTGRDRLGQDGAG